VNSQGKKEKDSGAWEAYLGGTKQTTHKKERESFGITKKGEKKEDRKLGLRIKIL